MLGHLVPCSGGKSIALQRERVYLGRRPQADKALPLGRATALCRLRRADGWWQADDLGLNVVRVNGCTSGSFRLNPGDELTIGRMRFRIMYDPPATNDEDAELIAAAVLSEAPVQSPATVAERKPPEAPAGVSDSFPKHGVRVDAPMIAAEESEFRPAHLVPLGGGPDFLVAQPSVTIGRKDDCDIVLPFSTISSNHCGLEYVDGYWRILDLGSRNGIRVDGVRCQEAWIYPRTRLSIADRRFELDYVPQGDPPEANVSGPMYSKPLMATLGVSEEQLNKALSRHSEDEQDEPQRKPYDLLGNL